MGSLHEQARLACHKDRPNFVRDFTELGEVDNPRICGGSAKNHGRSEDQGGLAELIEVDKSGFWVDPVWQRLEVDGGCLSELRSVILILNHADS